MKVLFVTGFTPAKENIRGVSAHPFFLLKTRPNNIDVSMITYNINQLSSNYIHNLQNDLGIHIMVEDIPFSIRIRNNKLGRFFSKRSIYTYINPSKKIQKEIDSFHPDVIWTYPNFFYRWSDLLNQYKFVHSAPDSNTLSCARDFIDTICSKGLIKRIIMNIWYQKSINNDKLGDSKNSIIHFVGIHDLHMYRKIVKQDNGFFILHPHYLLKNKRICFSNKLKILVAGNYDQYMKSGIDRIIAIFYNNPYNLKDKISLAFLGKGWEPIVNQLLEVEYDCNQIKWVDNYIDAIIKYDIQLTPITIGTGTKGKVLDAIGNGLLCIGTKYALENIAVRDKESCLLYRDAHEVPAILNSIYYHHKKYERMARKGREQVRKYHAPSRISQRFFGIIRQNFHLN